MKPTFKLREELSVSGAFIYQGGSPDGPTEAKRLENTLTTVPPRIVSKAAKARAPQRVHELEQFCATCGENRRN